MAPNRAAQRDIPVLIFALLFPTVTTWLYLVVLGSEPGAAAQPSLAVRISFAVGKVIQFALPLVYVGCLERDRIRLAGPTRRGMGMGIGFGLLVGLAMIGLFFGGLGQTELFAETPAKIDRMLRDMSFATPGKYLLLAVAYSVGHSLLEEYYWRWFVFGWLRRHVPVGAAIGVSALGFMAHHVVLLTVFFPGRFWVLALPLSLGVAVGGAVWAWIYHRSGSLYAVWISHGLVDAAIMAIGYKMLAPLWSA
jgi:membrane protease YdiL (CAAX protease family)